ncbi:hypothetical protein SCLCIDRAFT_469025 [Scleroderma citrinum Foug A]|uniref:BTB domain-containing protein n=1 Tax=Scleroderma citrinum Foug A TaxID=1036808 RepID=A0A0C3DXY1_9AGAM|nr:hypothetical protein SCLCIDRAFT_469025 [Scleroderma citrinum Foug A]
MSASPATLSYAASPFDHPQADVILRSSDDIYFRVFKLFLSLASPVFETMFGLPQPSEGANQDEETKDGLPVVSVSEGSKTLDALLRFCYPSTLAEDPPLDGFMFATEILEAAKKYSLDGIERIVCKALFIPKILEVDSLPCFAVARRADLHEQCVLAAKYSLREPLIPAWFEGMQFISSADLLALLTYHKNCADAVLTLQSNLVWIQNHYQQYSAIKWMFGCTSCKECPRFPRSCKYQLFGYEVALWWADFMDETFSEIRDRPCAQTVEKGAKEAIRKFRAQYDCSRCSSTTLRGIPEFVALFTDQMEEVTAKIQLGLRF